MKLPASVKAIRARWIAAKGLPQIHDGESDEAWTDRLRSWSVGFCEQVAHELPGQGWGTKRGDSGRPLAKDSIAQQQDGKLFGWDLLTGSGTGHPGLNDDPDSEDITGQYFETRPEFFNPQDRLGVGPVDPKPTDPPSSDLAGFIQDVRASLGRLETGLKAVQETLPPPPTAFPPFPKYQGKTEISLPLVGKQSVTVTLNPIKE